MAQKSSDTTTMPRTTRPTMDDVARIAKVSKPTVSRVLSGSPLVSADTRERVLAVAREQGYALNRHAQKLRRERANAIAVVLDFGSHRQGAIGDPFIFELLAGISEALSVRDLDLLLSPSGLDTIDGFVDLYQSRGADGFIVLGQGARDALLQKVARKDIPMVVWGAVNEASAYCAVGSDNSLGGRLAGERFLLHDRRRWLFVGSRQHEEIRLRFEGLQEAARENSDVEIDVLSIESMAFSAIHDQANAYLKTCTVRPDAVFAFSDTAAMAVIGAFSKEGHLTPRDYSLVGYNDIPPAAHFTPSITTIAQQTGVAGALLVEKLMQALDGSRPRSAMLPTQLVTRQT
ncbi:LacI family DNA-binding transcriptional regulator [Sphingopyxis macrogoltabida]|uniref:LacI family transcriptional regulator n=1 Tax=Sphingopyxis macrogoltabida TaxID=33050 RepID=A0A0N9V0Z8_SPHMC|nr:LacI family DNA-binding transcriptional regulator [Sphingopyxis macrogoltabida]ALH81566.1 LacI family transcriptional regulator [Sphingopyxis macrogoltabida]